MAEGMISHYRVIEKLGEGGMGEVYLARDSKLGRDVAIKVLPEAFSREPERLERLEREARLLAAINHPNIATLYGFEQAEGRSFLVMERVSGETLADRIKAGPMPVDEALPVFAQIAEGLEAAHERGIIHRDLKPANIKITEEDRVKILDFGLGKSLSVAVASSAQGATQPVTPSPHGGTSDGIILGTPAYMSPEQARGKPVDKRTDIWAFGCCLYETLTSERPFEGETASDAIAKILEADPDWEALPKDTPPRIRNLLWRCLQKDPQRRLRDIGEARFEISQVESGEAEVLALPGGVSAAGRSPRLHMVWGGLAVLVLGLILGGLILCSVIRPTRSTPTTTPARPRVVRSVILPRSKIADEALFNGGLAISRDGKRLAYVDQSIGTERMLYVQELHESEARPIPGTEGAIEPFFSPDGASLGYSDHSRQVLKVVPIRGGTPKALAECSYMRGGLWMKDDTIVYCPQRGSGLWSVSVTGGDRKPLTLLHEEEGELEHRWPAALPNGNILFTCYREHEGIPDVRLEVYSRASGERQSVLEGVEYGRYLPSGHLIFVQNASPFAARFDPNTLKLRSKRVPLPERVGYLPAHGGMQLACSDTGILAFIKDPSRDRELVWVDDRGLVEPLKAPRRAYEGVSLSPDEKQIALAIDSENPIEPRDSDIWLYDIALETLTPLTSDGVSIMARWLGNSTQLTFLRCTPAESTLGLFRLYTDGSQDEELLARVPFHFFLGYSLDKETRFLLGTMNVPGENNQDIVKIDLESESKTQETVVKDNSFQRFPEFSPDGRWFAYTSQETGTWEVYVKPFPGPGRRIPISQGGGYEARWDPYTSKLYYRNGDEMWAVNYEAETEFKPTQPQFLFKRHFYGGLLATQQNYSVAEDGRFLMIREDLEPGTQINVIQGDPEPGTQINLVVNWFEELNRLIPPEKE